LFVPGHPAPELAAIALGSNLGDRAANLAAAIVALGAMPSSTLRAVSPFFETAPVGPVRQGPYLNAAALLDTSLTPRRLLEQLQAIELSLGRNRSEGERWGPRTLDLDLLLVGNHIVDEPGLTLPHPQMLDRPFVLVPLAAIAPELRIPRPGPVGPTVREALGALDHAGALNPADCTLYPCP
jgi:2-amino-4-hydroxy-6-hydroxymethyldihydropteridine diphosphokinase